MTQRVEIIIGECFYKGDRIRKSLLHSMLIPTGFKKLCRWRISELISGFSKTFFYILIYIFRDRTHVGKPKNTFPACFTIEYVLVNNQRTTQILSDLQADPTDRIRLRDASCDGVHIFHTHTHTHTHTFLLLKICL